MPRSNEHGQASPKPPANYALRRTLGGTGLLAVAAALSFVGYEVVSQIEGSGNPDTNEANFPVLSLAFPSGLPAISEAEPTASTSILARPAVKPDKPAAASTVVKHRHSTHPAHTRTIPAGWYSTVISPGEGVSDAALATLRVRGIPATLTNFREMETAIENSSLNKHGFLRDHDHPFGLDQGHSLFVPLKLLKRLVPYEKAVQQYIYDDQSRAKTTRPAANHNRQPSGHRRPRVQVHKPSSSRRPADNGGTVANPPAAPNQPADNGGTVAKSVKSNY